MKTMHEKLKQLRKEKGLSQQELAQYFGYKSFTTIQKWEDGTSYPPLRILQELATLYSINVQQLLDEQAQVSVPIIGTVRGGPLRYAVEESIGSELVNSTENHGGDYFYLKVIGDSMIDARINPGDLVYVKRQSTLENGEIGIVLVDDEATIKRVCYESNCLILKPENVKYQALSFNSEDIKSKRIEIIGKVIHCKIML
jgi:repressor LexA